MAFDPVKIRIGATDETGKAFKSVETGLAGIEKKGVSVSGVLSKLAGPVTVAGAVMLGKAALNAGDEIKTLSDRLGVGAEALSEYKYIASQTGADFETLAKGLRTSMKSISEAAGGNKLLAERFAELGLETGKLKAMKPQAAFEAIGQAIADLPSEADRVAFSMALLGKAGADLIPVFADGAGGMAEMRETAARLGLVMTDETAAACDTANDAVSALTQSFMASATVIVAEMAPALADLAKDLAPIARSVGGLAGFFADFSTANRKSFLDLTNDADAYAKWEEAGRSGGRKAAQAFFDSWREERDKAQDGFAALTFEADPGAAPTDAMAVALIARTKATERATRAAAALAALDNGTTRTKAAGDTDKVTKAARELGGAMNMVGVAINGAFFTEGDRNPFLGMKVDLMQINYAAQEVATTGTRAFEMVGDAARATADSIANSVTAAVFDSKQKLIDLEGVARSVLGMLVSFGIRWGLATAFPAIAPAMGFAKSGGAGVAAPGGPPAAPPVAAPDKSAGAPVALTVNVRGVIDAGNPLSVRRLATAIYDELGAVARQHGPTGAVSL